MLRPLPTFLFAFWALAAPAGAVLAAEPVYPTGSQVGLAPPGNMKVSRRFVGFEDPDRNATIMILQLPKSAYEEILRSMFSKTQVGLSEVKRESFPFTSGVGYLVTGVGEENGVKAHKWFMLSTGLGDFLDLAVFIKVEVPDAASSIYTDAVIRSALSSISFRSPPVEEQLTTVPFKLRELAGFRVMRVVPNEGVILIDGAEPDMVKNPYLILTRGRGAPESPNDRAQFARDLMSTAPLRDIAVTLAEPMRIDGRPGFEVRATANGFDGKPLMLVQWLRFNAGDYMRIIAAVHKEDWDQYLTRFRAVRDGMEPR